MDNLASGTNRQFKNLLEEVAADQIAPLPATSRPQPADGDPHRRPWLRPALSVLGPSVGDDSNEVPSDLRLKEDVRRIGTTVFGLPVYHFKYLGRPETYEGVMAQEVLQVMPEAVSVGADGYYRVNYGALGTSMRQVPQDAR